MTIRSGAGGVDAADFAEMLMRCTCAGPSSTATPSRSSTPPTRRRPGSSRRPSRSTPYAYGTLSVEAGTHRLVRISPFDDQGRRQTSFAAVEVVPVLEQTDEIEIPDEEIRTDVCRLAPAASRSTRRTPRCA